ncbi:hypothetical protein OQA88_3382 [Cercophora sp. LCS_1]
MEIVIPPRDHGPSTYRYTWDENGEVEQVTRVRDEPSTPPPRRPRPGRQTVQWPFQSIATETEVSNLTPPSVIRPVTWQPKRIRDLDEDSIEQDLVPDYVRNYIRGETPETVARRQRNGGKLGERGVDIAHQHQPHKSTAAEIGDLRDISRLESANSFSGDDEEQRHILSGSREKIPHRKGWRRLMSGWQAGVALNTLFPFLILVMGIVWLVYAVTGGLNGGKAVLFEGSCERASTINWGLHVAINVFAIVLVAGANYVFQVLSSPTRAEVSVAHFRRKWLDIGIPSFRNLGHIESSRVWLAVIILTVAAFTQIIYNAVVFTSHRVTNHNIIFVTESFLTGAPFSNDTSSNSGGLSRLDILSLQQQATRNELVNLTTAACITEFSGAFSSQFPSALVITNRDSRTNSLIQTSTSTLDFGVTTPIDRLTTRFCLAQRAANVPSCTVSLHAPLLGAVTLLNLITVISTASILFKTSFVPLATLGDAITSFLRDPDLTTRGCCLLSKTDVRSKRWGLDAAKYWLPRNHYWFQTPSVTRWTVTMTIWVLITGPVAAALALALLSDPVTRLSPFGTVSPHAVVPLPTMPGAAAALVAALPHLLLVALYLAVNSLLTTFFLSHESSLFAVAPPRTLRVSANAEGVQSTSLYLTLPRPVSWGLLVLFTGMAFVLSQAVFPVHLVFEDQERAVVAMGISGAALLCLAALLVGLLGVVFGLGCRRAPAAALVNGRAVGNPMAMPGGSCSAVVSARCHLTEGQTGELWKGRVVWGMVREGVGMEVSHCGFDGGVVSAVDVSRCYA